MCFHFRALWVGQIQDWRCKEGVWGCFEVPTLYFVEQEMRGHARVARCSGPCCYLTGP